MEISALIEQSLPENVSISDGGLSEASKAFKKSLKDFLLEEHEKGSKIIMKFGEDATGESCETVKRVAEKIGGITEKQLRVKDCTFFFPLESVHPWIFCLFVFL